MEDKLKDFLIIIAVAVIDVIIASGILALLLGMTIEDGFFVLLVIAIVVGVVMHKQAEQERERIEALKESVYATICDVVYRTLDIGAWPYMLRITNTSNVAITSHAGISLRNFRVRIAMMTANRQPLQPAQRDHLQQCMEADLRNVLQGYGAQICSLKVGLPKTENGWEVVLVEVTVC